MPLSTISQQTLKPAILAGVALLLGLTPTAQAQDKKEPSAQEALKQRLKKYEDEATKLREVMLKECDDEIKKADEALKKAQTDLKDAKKDAEARTKAVQALTRAQNDKSKLQ